MFDYKQLDNMNKEKFHINLAQVDGVIHKADLWIRKSFMWIERLVFLADLTQPIKDIDRKITETEAKLEALKLERKAKEQQCIDIIKTFGNIYESRPLVLNGEKKDVKPLSESLGGDDKKSEKPKVTTRVASLKPIHNNEQGKQNNNQGKRNN